MTQSSVQSEQDYQCQFCEKQFPNARNLQRHTMTHTGEKPFGCHHCPYRTSRLDVLVLHLKRIHNQEATVKQLARLYKDLRTLQAESGPAENEDDLDMVTN